MYSPYPSNIWVGQTWQNTYTFIPETQELWNRIPAIPHGQCVYKSRGKFKTCCSEALLGIKQYVVFSHSTNDKKRWYPKILHWLQASEHGICLGADLLLCTDDSISVFSTAKWFSTWDLSSGYWRIPINLASSGKAAFVTTSGLHDRTIVPRPSCPEGLRHHLELLSD